MLNNKNEENAINQLLKRYYLREDLQKEFPEVRYGDYQRLIEWAVGVTFRTITDDDYDELYGFRDIYTKLKSKTLVTWNPLSENKEAILERKLVWIFGSPRSGSTWLSTQLLKHPDNIIWDEPYIGVHFNVNRLYQIEREDYIFSTRKKMYWLPALRKFILACAYAHSKTIRKNLIIKEPNGSEIADIILECLPNSKLIFLLRDGRDVVDSLVDAHQSNSWNPDLSSIPLTNQKIRNQKIEEHSIVWKCLTEITRNAFEIHPPQLRLLIKYEDLLKNTLWEVKRIYQFLQIKIDDDNLEKIIDRYSFDEIPQSEKGSGKFYRFATPGLWKEHFSGEEKQLMESIMGKVLKKLDY